MVPFFGTRNVVLFLTGTRLFTGATTTLLFLATETFDLVLVYFLAAGSETTAAVGAGPVLGFAGTPEVPVCLLRPLVFIFTGIFELRSTPRWVPVFTNVLTDGQWFKLLVRTAWTGSQDLI